MTIYYSSDSERYEYNSIDEAIESATSDFPHENGDLISVYSGESVPVDITKYIPDICEFMQEIAYDDVGDIANNFPDATVDLQKEIQDEVEAIVVSLFKKHSLIPTFYNIKNEKEITVKILNVETGEYEIVEETNEI